MGFRTRASTPVAGTLRSSPTCAAGWRRQKPQLSILKRSTVASISALCCLALAVSAAAAARPPITIVGRPPGPLRRRGHAGPTRLGRSASPRLGDAGRPWRDNEDWALLEATPRFTVGDGENAATFWTALSTAGAELGQRTPGELQRRIEELAAEKGLGRGSYGGEPVVLSSWARMPDGRFTGSVDGRSVWLTAEMEGKLKSDPRGGPGYIVSLGGRVYELGEPWNPKGYEGAVGGLTKERSFALEAETATPKDGTQFDVQSGLRSILGYLSIALLSGGAGIYIGANSLVQLPGQATSASMQKATPPPTTQIQIIQQAAPAKTAVVKQTASPTTTTPTKKATRETAQLLLSEQRVRQQIQVDARQSNIGTLESKLKIDEESIPARVAAEEARLQTNRERQVITDKERLNKFGSNLRADVERKKNDLNRLKLKLREDQEQLAELQRVEQERGPNAMAVEMSVLAPGSSSDVQKN